MPGPSKTQQNPAKQDATLEHSKVVTKNEALIFH